MAKAHYSHVKGWYLGRRTSPQPVILAKAGIHFKNGLSSTWIPAFARMTDLKVSRVRGMTELDDFENNEFEGFENAGMTELEVFRIGNLIKSIT